MAGSSISDAQKTLGDKPEFMRLFGSMPWFKAREKKRYRAKVFKSGNSLAVRLPSGLELKAGMEMDLTVEDGKYLTLDPIGAPKRKFDIAKVAGSATSLEYVDDRDRLFDDRPSARGERPAK